ncbi:MAG: PQQ-dependent sugar dehydrogenase [Flavisolibacter sp.]
MFKNGRWLILFGWLCASNMVLAQGEPFTKRVVASGLNSPWEIIYGPNDSIWVTESVTYLVKRINIANGSSTTLLNLSSLKNFSIGDGGRWPQGGLMGMALHPNLFSTSASVRGAKPWVYLAYVYNRPTGQTCSTDGNSGNPCNFLTRIVRYDYNGSTLSNPEIILDNMPGSNDHNSGRLIIGPDLKLYYTIGDMGAGQFNNSSRTNNAQTLDIMEGKILRLNSEPVGIGADRWVPNDNPFYNGLPVSPRDYVYSRGHRNAQGIVWANVNGTDRLFSSEHGDKTDDEVNLITPGNNYGWNRVSGYCDDNYNGLTLGGYSGVDEGAFNTANATNREPLKTLFTLNKTDIMGLGGSFTSWPTVAPSSIDLYTAGKIPGWQNSVLVTCLKAGRVYRLKLNASGTGVTTNNGGTDTASYFRGEGRFRDMAIAPNGVKFYMACDASGQTSGPTGGFNGGGTPPPNAGRILEFSYSGIILPINDHTLLQPGEVEKKISVYPSPTTGPLMVSVKIRAAKPFYVDVFSMAGVRLKSQKTTRADLMMDISDLPAGMYYVQVRNAYDQVLQTNKVIKL